MGETLHKMVHEDEDNHYLKQELYKLVQTDESIFEFFQSGSLDGMWYWDLINPNHEWMSRKFWETLGFDPREMPHNPSAWQDLIFPEDLELALDNFKKHCENPDYPYDQVVRYRHKNGSIVWVRCRGLAIRNELGEPIRLLGTHVNVTNHMHTIHELKDSELKFRTLAENSLDYIITVNKDLIMTYVNKKITGIPVVELIGQSVLNHIAPNYHAMVIASIETVFATANGCHYEISYTPEGQETIWYETTASPIMDKGKVKEVMLLTIDVTGRKRVAAEIIAEKEKAEEANRAKSRFLANMSHEIRTPLNGIMGTMQLLKLEGELNEEQLSLIDIATSSSQTLLRVINDILDYSKIEAGKIVLERVNFSLQGLLKDVKNLFMSSITQKHLEFVIDISPQIPKCLQGDPFRIHQIISNLVGNAIKFTSEGFVSVRVDLLNHTEDRVMLKFDIQDTGIGISQEGTLTIFESFSQVDSSTTRQFGGTGLGLAICKSLVEQMNGQISVKSDLGHGSLFTFTCELGGICSMEDTPIYNEEVDKKEVKPLQILIVEDDPTSQIVMSRLCSKKGWEATVSENGEKAVELYKKQDFDLIVMDIQMPIMDGYSATSLIRKIELETYKHTPIIALTAFALSGDKEKCLQTGMDDFLTKPIQTEDFYAHVLQLVKPSNE